MGEARGELKPVLADGERQARAVPRRERAGELRRFPPQRVAEGSVVEAATVGRLIARSALEKQRLPAGVAPHGVFERADVIGRELQRFGGNAGWVRGEVDDGDDGFAGPVVQAQEGHVAVAGLGFELGLAVAIAALDAHCARGQARGLEARVGLDHAVHDGVLELLVIAQRRVELPAALARLVAQLHHRSMVGVRSGDDQVLDGSALEEAAANALEALFGRRTAQIEAHDGEFAAPRLKHHGVGVQRVERALAERIVAGGVAPHGDRLARGDVAPRRARPEGARLLGMENQGQREERADGGDRDQTSGSHCSSAVTWAITSKASAT